VSCSKFRTDLTAYLEGDLPDERGSAVRGHLRGCEDCRRAAADEAALRDGLRALPPLDPPASLWAGVQQRLAAEEVADAERPTWRRMLSRWMPKAPQLALGGAVLAGAIVLVVVRSQQTDERTRAVTAPMKIEPVVIAPSTHVEPALPPVVDDDRDVSDVLASAASRLSDDYADAARELLPLAKEARARWSQAQQQEFDAHIAELDRQVSTASDERAKQRGYRALIRYLQRAAIRDDVALASTGGAP
jgi:hypothetical protein